MRIDRGGICEGVLQRVPEGREWEILADLWRRGMTVRPPSDLPRRIEGRVRGEAGTRPAIAFTAKAEGPNYAGGLSAEEVAEGLAGACGHWGSGADYLFQTVVSLEREGIHDPYLWDLEERVAAVIEARHGAGGGDRQRAGGSEGRAGRCGAR